MIPLICKCLENSNTLPSGAHHTHQGKKLVLGDIEWQINRCGTQKQELFLLLTGAACVPHFANWFISVFDGNKSLMIDQHEVAFCCSVVVSISRAVTVAAPPPPPPSGPTLCSSSAKPSPSAPRATPQAVFAHYRKFSGIRAGGAPPQDPLKCHPPNWNPGGATDMFN